MLRALRPAPRNARPAPETPAEAGPAEAAAPDPITEAAERAKERLRRQREVAVTGLDAVAAGKPVWSANLLEAVAREPDRSAARAAGPAATVSAGRGSDIEELREEVEGLRRELTEAVARLSREIERAERVAAERARKEARRQGRKSERAARRAARAAVDTPDARS